MVKRYLSAIKSLALILVLQLTFIRSFALFVGLPLGYLLIKGVRRKSNIQLVEQYGT